MKTLGAFRFASARKELEKQLGGSFALDALRQIDHEGHTDRLVKVAIDTRVFWSIRRRALEACVEEKVPPPPPSGPRRQDPAGKIGVADLR